MKGRQRWAQGEGLALGGARLPDLRRDREEARPRAHEAVGAGRGGFGAFGSGRGTVEAGLVGAKGIPRWEKDSGGGGGGFDGRDKLPRI